MACLGTLWYNDALKRFGRFVLLSCSVIIIGTQQGISRPMFILQKMRSERKKKENIKKNKRKKERKGKRKRIGKRKKKKKGEKKPE